jgi:hypothetical protein
MKLSTASKVLAVVLGSAIALTLVVGVAVATTQAASYVFTRTLKLGSTGTDVMQLQKVLNANPATQVAVTGAGSPGMESTYFGGLTKAAVIKFQNLNAAAILTPVGLTQGTGLVGVSTRALLNNGTSPVVTSNCPAGALFNPQTGAPCTTNPVVTNGPVSVSLANAASYGALVSPSATAQLASFTFTGSAQINNLSFQRTGVSSDLTLSNVYLYEGATRITDAASVSNGSINFNNTSGILTVNGSQTVTVRADIASGYGGNTIGVTLASYTVAGGTPVAANVAGMIQTIATNTNAATVNIQSGTGNSGVLPVIAGVQVNAGTSNYTVFSVPVNVGTRAVYLNGVTFRFIGSAPASALANIGLYVDGSQVATGAINVQSNLVFDLSAKPLTLNTGGHTVEVRADVIGGAYRNFQLSLQNSGDLMVADSQLQGVNVAPFTAQSGSAPSIVYTFSPVQAGLVTIAQGTLSVTTDPAFTTQTTVTGGASNVPIAQFKVTSYGEDVKINTVTVQPALTGSTLDGSLNNVSLYVNGAQVGSNQNLTAALISTGLTYQLGSSLVVPAGQTVTLTVKADTISNTTNTAYSSGNILTTLTIPVSAAQGVQSGQLYPTASALVSTSNTLSIGNGAATIAKNTNLSNQTLAPNTASARIASFVVQAGSSEGLRLNNIAIYLVGANLSNSATVSNVLNNLKVVVNGTAVGNTTGSVTGTNNFNVNNVTVLANQTATIDVFADINNYTGSVTASTTVSAQGLTSNLSTTGSATGQTTTIGTGILSAPVLESISPVGQFRIGGTSFQVGTYNFISTTTPATISELYFTVTNPSTVSSLAISGPGLSSAQTATVVGSAVNVTGLNLVVPSGYAGIDVGVTPKYNTVDGINLNSGTVSTVTLTGYKVTVGNTTVATTTLSVPSNGMVMVGAIPSLTIASPTTKLGSAAALTEVADITVAADASGSSLRVHALPLTFTTSANSTIASSSSATTTVEVDVNGVKVANATYSDMAIIAASGSGSMTITFPSTGYLVTPSQGSVTFQVKVTTNTTGSPTSGQASVATKLGSAGSFGWVDVAGNNTAETGASLLGTQYPTGSATITNP